MREIEEELSCEIDVGDEVTTTTHEYDFGIVNLTTFYCTILDGTPDLLEHAQISWRDPKDLQHPGVGARRYPSHLHHRARPPTLKHELLASSCPCIRAGVATGLHESLLTEQS